MIISVFLYIGTERYGSMMLVVLLVDIQQNRFRIYCQDSLVSASNTYQRCKDEVVTIPSRCRQDPATVVNIQ
jgi:hypothetical protein